MPRTAKIPPKEKLPELVPIGVCLRMLRDERELTQEQLAEAAGLHWSYIGQIERAERNFTVKILLALEHGLGIGPGELLHRALGDVSLPSTG